VSLSIESRRLGAHSVVLGLHGEVDYATAQDLRASISAILVEGDVDTIVADLAGVTFLDSTGIGTLVVAYRICADCGVRFTARDPNAFIAKLLTVLGVGQTIGVPPVPGLRRPRRPLHEALDSTPLDDPREAQPA